MNTNIRPQNQEKTQTPKPTQRAAPTPPDPPAILGSTIPLITEPSLDTERLIPKAKANSFPLNH
jgi:hypothetical protein